MKENELFSFIQTGPVVLIASGSALVGFRPISGDFSVVIGPNPTLMTPAAK